MVDTSAAKQFRIERRFATLLGAAAVVYAAIHLALLWRFPWFVDETIFASYAQVTEGDPAQRFAALSDHKGLIVTWLGALLIHVDVSPMTAMRLISILSGAVAAVATGAIGWRWVSRPVGIGAGLLVAFVPFFVVHASVGIYDTFVAAAAMLSLLLQLELAQRPRLSLSVLLGLSLGIAILAKPTGALAIALIPISLLVFDWRDARRGRRLLAWTGGIAVAMFVCVVLWSLTRLSPLAYTPAPPNRRTIGELVADPFEIAGDIAGPAWEAFAGYLTLPVLVAAIWGLIRIAKGRNRAGAVFVIWAAAAIAAYLLLTIYGYPRYGLGAVPPLCLLAAVGAVDLLRRARDDRLRYSAWAVLVLPGIFLNAYVVVAPDHAPYPGLDREQFVSGRTNREPVRAAAEAILGEAQGIPGQGIPIAYIGDEWPWAMLLTLNGERYTTAPRFQYVSGEAERQLANTAPFVIVTGDLPPWLDVAAARTVGSWQRDGGPTTTLYARRPGPQS